MDHHAVADPPLLPPGCRFHPSKDQLRRHYLLKKNGNSASAAASGDRIRGYGFDVIKEVDVGRCNPFDLPECCCYCCGYKGRRRHRYRYRARVLKERLVRRTANGFSMRRGRVKDALGNGGGVVLGKRQDLDSCSIWWRPR